MGEASPCHLTQCSESHNVSLTALLHAHGNKSIPESVLLKQSRHMLWHTTMHMQEQTKSMIETLRGINLD